MLWILRLIALPTDILDEEPAGHAVCLDIAIESRSGYRQVGEDFLVDGAFYQCRRGLASFRDDGRASRADTEKPVYRRRLRFSQDVNALRLDLIFLEFTPGLH